MSYPRTRRRPLAPAATIINAACSCLAMAAQVVQEAPGGGDGAGHSYGSAVITEAGNHPALKALVYIAAFAPDKGESVNTLIADPPPGRLAGPLGSGCPEGCGQLPGVAGQAELVSRHPADVHPPAGTAVTSGQYAYRYEDWAWILPLSQIWT